MKPKLKGKRSHGSQEHDGDAKVEDDQEELGLLAVALEVSSGRLWPSNQPLSWLSTWSGFQGRGSDLAEN